MPLAIAELRQLAQAKVRDAQLLFDNQRYSNAYYLFGYGVELGIKARIARVFIAGTIPDKQLVLDVYTYDLTRLMALSGLKPTLANAQAHSPVFAAHWAAVADWSEQSRYDMVDEFRATAMRNAMLDKENGVFQWLQNNW